MNVTKLKFDARSLGKKLLLIDVVPVYSYDKGVRTDEVAGYRYIIVAEQMAFEKLGVKIMGEKLMDKPEQGYREVAFDGLELYPYYREGSCEVAAIATGIREVKTGQ